MRKSRYFDRKKSQMVFTRFLGSIFLVLIIPFLILLVVYGNLNARLTRQAYERNLGILQNSVEKMELLYQNLDQIGLYLSEAPEMISYCSMDSPHLARDTTAMLQAQKLLTTVRLGNENILNVQFYSGRSNTLIDFYSNAFYIERYYGSSFHIQDVDGGQFEEHYLKSPDSLKNDPACAVIAGKTRDVLIYARQYRNLGPERNMALFYLDQQQMLNLFEPLGYQDGGFLLILDGEGNPILTDNPEGYELGNVDWSTLSQEKSYTRLSLGGKEMFATWYRSGSRGWTCVEVVPVSGVLGVTGTFRGFMYFLLLLAAFTGVGLVILISWRLAEPLMEIGELLGDQEKRMPLGEFVKEVRQLVDRNRVLTERIQQHVSAMRAETFCRFISGKCQNEAEAAECLEKTGIRSDAAWYVILLVSCDDMNVDTCLEDISTQKVYLENIIREQKFPEVEDVYHIDLARLVILMVFDQGSARQVKERAEELAGSVKEAVTRDAFYRTLDRQASISLGGDLTDNALKLPEVFLHTQKALGFSRNIFGNHRVQWYDRVREYLDMESYELGEDEKDVPLQTLVLVNRVKKYLQENYGDPQLSLTQVGDEFGITEGYLSRAFKQVTGENFSKYLEGIRMTRARELTGQNRKVKEIAQMVGYNSPQVFRRAWKRYYGED